MTSRGEDKVIISALLRALAARDFATAMHSKRVARLARRIATEMGSTPAESETVYRAGMLHDIGKLKTKDSILSKPGPLTESERRRMEAHVKYGVRILSNYPCLYPLIPMVASHHERVDGKGYPVGLAGNEDIPLGGRILAVADTYDCMTSDRPYRDAMERESARKVLREGAGTQWDEAVVSAFLGPVEEGPSVGRPFPRPGRPPKSCQIREPGPEESRP